MSADLSEGPCTSTSTDKEKMESKIKAMNLLAQGKRNLICKEIPSAVQLFQDACESLSSTFGEMASECADAYFEYGGALLELARMEQGVLGLALKDVDVDEEESEADQKKETEEADEGGTEDDEQEKEEEDNEDEEEAEAGEEMEEGEKQNGDKEEDADADDVSNLQLAWEMIELSRIIYNREGNKLKQAEAHLKLGEISLESEQFATAINDFKTCLEIQLQNMEPHDRAIAETHYQIGIAQQLHKEHLDQAADSFRAALKCLELKIEKLKETIKEDPPTEPGSVYSPKEAAVKEIEDIEKVLPEIQEKIKEIEAEISEEGNLKQMAKEAMGALFASNSEVGFSLSKASTTLSKEEKPAAMDINHLIRKKRKPEEAETVPVDDKKQKQTDASDSTTNGHSEETAGKTEAA